MLGGSSTYRNLLVFKHKAGEQNTVADTLSRRHELLIVLYIIVSSFDNLPTMYEDDEDFATIWEECLKMLGTFTS